MSDVQGTGATIELRRKICQAAERAAELETERSALDEIRDGLEVHGRELLARLSAVQREHAGLLAQLEQRTGRLAEIEREIEAAEVEVAALERQCAAHHRRAERVAREADAMAGDMRACRGSMSAGEVELQGLQNTLARMDRKLGAAERKRTGGG